VFEFFVILATVLNAQVKIVDSNGLNFKPLTASFYEPRMGLMKYFDRNSLKVDIGNSLDIFQFPIGFNRLTVGADFFAYTLVNNHGFLVLRVEAIDGFFGGNVSFRSDSFSARFRVLHRSAHLVDEYDELSVKPFPFTMEFFDLLFALEKKTGRFYAGLNYIFRSKPRDLKKIYVQIGFEFYKEIATQLSFFKSPILFVFSSDLKFRGSQGLNLTGGVKFGRLYSRGLLFYLVYYDGFDIYGQYFNLRRKFGGFGLSFDF
jgi:hypothetical protein